MVTLGGGEAGHVNHGVGDAVAHRPVMHDGDDSSAAPFALLDQPHDLFSARLRKALV